MNAKRKPGQRIFRIAVLAAACVLAAVLAPAAALGETLPCQTGTAHGSYSHPVTGEVADSAGPVGQAIGQAMVDKVVDGPCLLEQGESTWLSLRFNLANSISGISFEAQEPSESTWEPAAYSTVANGEDSVDLRVKVPSASAILRTTFHVDAIDRSVVFFISEDDWKDGNDTQLQQMDAADEPSASTAASAVSQEAEPAECALQAGSSFWMTLFLTVFCAVFFAVVLAGVVLHNLFGGIGRRTGGCGGKRKGEPATPSEEPSSAEAQQAQEAQLQPAAQSQEEPANRE